MESPAGRRSWGWCIAALLAGAGLVFSNPGDDDFEEFAGAWLVGYASKELCSPGGLPLMARLLLHNCPELIQAQQQTLGRLVVAESRRYNAGLFSLYSTQLGGQTLLPGLRIPRYSALTLAGAGHFVVLRASSDER